MDPYLLPWFADVPSYIAHYAKVFPAREAAVDGEARLTYEALSARMNDGGSALLAAGLVPGERVAFFGFPGTAYLQVLLATLQAGAVYVGLNPKYTASELRYVITHAAPRLVVIDPRTSDDERKALAVAMADVSGDPPVEVQIDNSVSAACAPLTLTSTRGDAPYPIVAHDAAAIVYTSGTTGKPKGAVIRQRGLAHEGRLFAQRYVGGDVSRTTRVLNNLPVNHIGCIGDLTCAWLVMAATIVFMPRFEPGRIGEVLAQEAITFYFQVPAMFQLALAEDLDLRELPALRSVAWGGAQCPRPLVEKFAAWGFDLSNTYGLSECTGTCTATLPSASINELASSVGAALETNTVRIAPDGEVQVIGDLVFAGYLNDEASTRQAFTDDGWLRTSDIGEFDRDGNIVLKGRLSEMFKSGGYNVYPREIEEALERIPGIDLAAVIAVADPLWSEVGHAFVIAGEGMTMEPIVAALTRELANYKVPKHFTIATDLPRLPIGKIDKQALRKMLASTTGDARQ